MFMTERIRWGGASDCLNSHKWKPSGNDFSMQVVPAGEAGERLQFYCVHDGAEASLLLQDLLEI